MNPKFARSVAQALANFGFATLGVALDIEDQVPLGDAEDENRKRICAPFLIMSNTSRPPLPPFTLETAVQKARMAEDAWNSRDPARVALAYSEDSRWRNRAEFFEGRSAIIAFLTRKWAKEIDYRLIKELWAFHDNRIAVRFQYEWRDDSGHWFRSYGNEQWEFDGNGLMRRREASINDVPIAVEQRKFLWPAGARPSDHPGLTELGM
jgi:nuclear transport factor 2 (NTF2) superfamily protein